MAARPDRLAKSIGAIVTASQVLCLRHCLCGGGVEIFGLQMGDVGLEPARGCTDQLLPSGSGSTAAGPCPYSYFSRRDHSWDGVFDLIPNLGIMDFHIRIPIDRTEFREWLAYCESFIP